MQKLLKIADTIVSFSSKHLPVSTALKIIIRVYEAKACGNSIVHYYQMINLKLKRKLVLLIHSVGLTKNALSVYHDDQVRWEFLKYEIRKFTKFSKTISRDAVTEKNYNMNKNCLRETYKTIRIKNNIPFVKANQNPCTKT